VTLNIANIIAFRVTGQDAEELAPEFMPPLLRRIAEIT
jgi:hypothetical protein